MPCMLPYVTMKFVKKKWHCTYRIAQHPHRIELSHIYIYRPAFKLWHFQKFSQKFLNAVHREGYWSAKDGPDCMKPIWWANVHLASSHSDARSTTLSCKKLLFSAFVRLTFITGAWKWLSQIGKTDIRGKAHYRCSRGLCVSVLDWQR